MRRRQFLTFGAQLCAATIATLGSYGWIARSAATTPNPKRLIVLFLRGGIDGLNVVVPYGDSDYYQARPAIAIPRPQQEGGAIKLDQHFGLHPSLNSLLPLWNQGSLAFVHACGSPDPTRSHFEAQHYMEVGTPGNKRTPDGWMNRLLGLLPGQNPVDAVSVGQSISAILSGSQPVSNISLGRNASRQMPIDRDQVRATFDRLYANNDPLSVAYQEGRSARDQLIRELEAEMVAANNGAPLPAGLAGNAQQLATLVVRDPQIRLAFLDVGGWDTHVNQGSSRGLMANRLERLGEGLVALVDRLGSVYSNTTIVVMSEFGRTVRENGNGGTDHGRGNVLWVLGGSVRGGRVYGSWPGLSDSELYEGRDLAVTTDFRDVISPILTSQFGLTASQLGQVFPGYRPTGNFSEIV
ncbi:MAG: DUF1501 domain-containing protein [Limnospira sp. PMC 1291.21]|uniref:DUF1501 domain-containing protein n=2 Tax=Limnospira TaxID=2596745 RepID=A0A9P1KHU1_9CYAN|nr:MULTISPECIES: DUF1501 domain-containing protein [Limnospira]MDC0837341.1 DUF1501 domain-containing protein [Limnoraphis robusta]MDY7052110.1 DUF1501 domain-containing protein [Limnospira fusiformis LS22]QJB26092.1 DUF1501 domain-containing protein [Limnospira fusiformis SAG 85.79]EDZ92153.1 protein of unknown function DUF1501 [Limnospira maxima CS-328]MDT9176460.1 DUF1501 domain-containing protein [Limnospira sp. PMC 1238.20]